ncbi:hypothetical protein MPNT_220030 [Candidatus Methylacidithermus pantelleriae]|uniref:Uncharacterized protein n=1 Tax=Candidatus Methylacidithermus pantelleriae TaxID=2744239 RepID=A0A8J2BPT9_9BACT|nr:hypothetical protein MPNT_220030 [Candidatus Methylacidithermus pantelleriae]
MGCGLFSEKRMVRKLHGFRFR